MLDLIPEHANSQRSITNFYMYCHSTCRGLKTAQDVCYNTFAYDVNGFKAALDPKIHCSHTQLLVTFLPSSLAMQRKHHISSSYSPLSVSTLDLFCHSTAVCSTF